ncbi:MAG TPA: HAD family hydrolase [Nevskiaceae bacterium]|nr:HAD family hydrolase [Nevskiaceae bacterium]
MRAVVFDLNGTLLNVRENALYPHAAELLAMLRRLGVSVGVLTSGSNHSLETLEQLGVRHYFGSVVPADRILYSKPHPSGLLLVLEELRAQPHEAIMVGDMAVDILAGKNAAVGKTVGVTHGFGSSTDLQTAGADHLIPNLAHLLDVLE